MASRSGAVKGCAVLTGAAVIALTAFAAITRPGIANADTTKPVSYAVQGRLGPLRADDGTDEAEQQEEEQQQEEIDQQEQLTQQEIQQSEQEAQQQQAQDELQAQLDEQQGQLDEQQAGQ
jgi:hypothetical protein